MITCRLLRLLSSQTLFSHFEMFAVRLTIVVGLVSVLILLLRNRTSLELVFHPDRYHGISFTKNKISFLFSLCHLGDSIQSGIFFEGWYFKLAFDDYDKTFILIPGVHMNDDNRHAFIMVAYGNISHYYRFPFESFSSSTEEFIARIDDANNMFTYDKLSVNLRPQDDDDASESFRMKLTFSSHVFVPDLSVIAPGTMGPFSWIPTMQCYHHVLSMQFNVHGSVQINDDQAMTVSGTGYLEKDWGHSFPSSWIWAQANQWENLPSTTSSASLFFSFALIPWYFNLEFPGFLIIFEHNGQFYRFNTYLQSIVNDLSIDKQTNRLSFDVYDIFFQYKLHVNTHFNANETINGAMLYGPKKDRMEKFVQEILVKNLFFDVRLSRLTSTSSSSSSSSSDPFTQHGYSEEILFDQRAHNIALEVTGDVDGLRDRFLAIYANIYPWQFFINRLFSIQTNLFRTSLF